MRRYEAYETRVARMDTHCDPMFPPICEHCEGERGDMVRLDRLRGWVCPDCDSSLDEMFGDRRAE